MNHKYLCYLVLCLVMSSCRKTHVTELRPFGADYSDSTKVLELEAKYPYMKLITDKAIHLQVHEKETKDNSVVYNKEPINLRIRYLPLETTEDGLVGGRIAKLESDESFIFIFDEDNNQVLRFSKEDGSFLNKYGSYGRGPGEYVGISDMSLNRRKKEVCLIDFSGYKFLYYDYDGHLQREEPLYYFYGKVEFLNDYMIQYTGSNGNTMAPSVNNNRLVFARQSDQAPEYVCFPFPENVGKAFGQTMKHPFVTCGEEVYYNYLLSDTIWQIKPNGTCEAKYVFKFPGRDNLFDENDFRNMSGDVYARKTKEAKYYYRDNIRITRDFVYAGITNGKYMLYCIPTGNYRYGMLTCKGFGDHQLLHNLLTLDGKSFVKVLQPFDILKFVNHMMGTDNENARKYFWENNLTEDERRMLQKMTTEDNPILMIIDIEPF